MQLSMLVRVILVLITFLTGTQFAVADTTDGVKIAVDLKRDAEQARQDKIPLMMFFAAEDCGFCERLEADHLRAMSNSSEYKKRVIIRKVVIDSYTDMLDFNGKETEASDFSDRFNIQVTPTLVMVDHEGTRIGRRIIGYNNSDFFGVELDSVIDAASKK